MSFDPKTFATAFTLSEIEERGAKAMRILADHDLMSFFGELRHEFVRAMVAAQPGSEGARDAHHLFNLVGSLLALLEQYSSAAEQLGDENTSEL